MVQNSKYLFKLLKSKLKAFVVVSNAICLQRLHVCQ